MKATLCIYISGPIEPGGAVRDGTPQISGAEREPKRAQEKYKESVCNQQEVRGGGIGALCGREAEKFLELELGCFQGVYILELGWEARETFLFKCTPCPSFPSPPMEAWVEFLMTSEAVQTEPSPMF